MIKTDADLFNVDHVVDLKLASDIYGYAKKAFKGNLNPVADMLYAKQGECKRENS